MLSKRFTVKTSATSQNYFWTIRLCIGMLTRSCFMCCVLTTKEGKSSVVVEPTLRSSYVIECNPIENCVCEVLIVQVIDQNSFLYSILQISPGGIFQ